MLINLTNHPYSQWDDNQREVAEVYGVCVDMQFPNIPAEADEVAVDALVRAYADRIMHLAGCDSVGIGASLDSVVVHIMGEQTFCYALICRLSRAGIRCVASCTVRDVTILPDGSKHVRFHFSRFREYFSDLHN